MAARKPQRTPLRMNRDHRLPMNRLLAAIPAAEMDVLAPDLERVPLRFKQVIYQADQPIESVCFPHQGVISMVQKMQDGTVVEVATVGPEGFVGLPVFLDAHGTSGDAFAQVPGEASLMGAGAFRRAIEQTPRLRELLSRYTLALLNQLAQNSACNRAHAIEQRLARWLLQTQDRTNGETFPLTQEFMSQMLGVARPTVSIAANILQKAGLIAYMRGNVTVTDRAGLEAASCECYGVVARGFERMVGSKG